MKKSLKTLLLSSGLLAGVLLASPLVGQAKKNNNNVNQADVHVNQKDPQKNQTVLTNKQIVTNPNNTVQTGQSTTDTLNKDNGSASLVDYSSQNYFDDYGYSHMTRYNLEHMQDGITTDAQNPMANFRGLSISDVKTAIDTRPGVKGQPMNVWDSWPLQDAQGNEVTYKGYHITFALAGNPNKDKTTDNGTVIQDVHIYVFYQKVGDENKGISSWKNAGQLFTSGDEGSSGVDRFLNHEAAQWSGETVKMSDGTLRLFYTSFPGDYDNGRQVMATAQIGLKKTKKGIAVDQTAITDHKTILQPDGEKYQKLEQALNDSYDENAFRDAHYFEYNGNKYLIFEANSGTDTGYQGEDALYNTAFLGGDATFQKQEQNLIIPTTNADGNINPWHIPAKDYNAVIGIVQLNNDYTVKQIMNPLLGLNTITDEFERPNIIEHNGKWYLFGITRGYKLATPNVKSTNSFMLGFVADSPFGPYKPLNGNGLVLRNTRAWSSRYYDYSAYVLNNKSKTSNKFLVTSYMTNSKQAVGHQTFAPSFTITLDGDKATVNKNDVYPQGAVTTKNTKRIQKNK